MAFTMSSMPSEDTKRWIDEKIADTEKKVHDIKNWAAIMQQIPPKLTRIEDEIQQISDRISERGYGSRTIALSLSIAYGDMKAIVENAESIADYRIDVFNDRRGELQSLAQFTDRIAAAAERHLQEESRGENDGSSILNDSFKLEDAIEQAGLDRMHRAFMRSDPDVVLASLDAAVIIKTYVERCDVTTEAMETTTPDLYANLIHRDENLAMLRVDIDMAYMRFIERCTELMQQGVPARYPVNLESVRAMAAYWTNLINESQHAHYQLMKAIQSFETAVQAAVA